MCICLGRTCFAIAITITTLPAWVLLKLLLCVGACFPSILPRVHRLSLIIVSWAWWTTIKLLGCCCIFRLQKVNQREMNESLNAATGKPRVMIFNHCSFMDAISNTHIFPLRSAQFCKILAAGYLFKMPFLGTIFEAVGAIKIPFKANEEKPKEEPAPAAAAANQDGNEPLTKKESVHDMRVDKEVANEVMTKLEAWLRAGNMASWAPEGSLNRRPEKMQMFRAGGFMPVVRVDSLIWCICYAGYEVFWHRKAPIGGTPANCRAVCFKLCESSFELIKELSKGEEVDEKQKCLLLANYAQNKFQDMMDEQQADPWVSKLPPLEDEKGVALNEAS